MCGIFGVNSKLIPSNYNDIFKSVGILSESRGKEASGWAAINDKGIYLSKSPSPFSSNDNLSKLEIFKKSTFETDWQIGHTRLKTHGEVDVPENNQPCSVDNDVLVHNGILTNYKDLATEKNFPENIKLDSLIIAKLINLESKNIENLKDTLIKSIELFKGEITLSGYSKQFNKYYLYSNTGSIYYLLKNNKIAIFCSEYTISKKINKILGNKFDIHKVKKNECLIFDNYGVITDNFTIETNGIEKNYKDLNSIKEEISKKVNIPIIERCKKCILPQTVPFISFNKNGVCNFCENYENHSYRPISELKKVIQGKRIISGLSGGRDSSYGLLAFSESFDVELTAVTYDWGMVTELARRNQARVVGKLGIEHIWISADILKKRAHIKKNLLAWLEKPHAGLIPILMAGDKVWQSKLNESKKNTKSDFIVQFECPYEETFFKYGFAKVKPSFKKEETYSIMSLSGKLKLFKFYVFKILSNYRYYNFSILDSLAGFYSFYFGKKDYIYPYNYINFNEDNINNVLAKEFQWEFDDTVSTSWRIGDGTSPFYNYLYYKYAGFTENDFFRSNQIREGILDRQVALNMVHIENQPREKRIKEYLSYIDLEFEYVEEKLKKFFETSLVEEWEITNIEFT